MSELVCVTSGCKDGGVGIETRGARRIAFCAKSCDLWTGASASASPRSSRADAAAAAATSQLRESSAFEKLRLPVGLSARVLVLLAGRRPRHERDGVGPRRRRPVLAAPPPATAGAPAWRLLLARDRRAVRLC